MIITIARQCGCHGDEIGLKLAKEYGLSFYNKEHIIKLAKEKGIYDKFPYFFSEIPVNALMHTIVMMKEIFFFLNLERHYILL